MVHFFGARAQAHRRFALPLHLAGDADHAQNIDARDLDARLKAEYARLAKRLTPAQIAELQSELSVSAMRAQSTAVSRTRRVSFATRRSLD